jgi:glycosyltransferase involved in cell wall biosynthesis
VRVLHLYAGNLYGGIETLLATLARVRNVCPGVTPEFGLCFEGRLSSELRAAGVKVHLLGKVQFSLPWTVWSARRRLTRLLRESSPDAVVTHACWPHAVFAPAVRKTDAPLVFWCHDFLDSNHWLNRRAALTRPDQIIANSRWTAGAAANLFHQAPVEVLYYPIGPSAVDPSRRKAVRDATATRDDAVVILIACRLEEWKGHPLLLEALGALKDDPRWVGWVAGGVQRPHEREYLEGLRSQEAALGLTGRIRWLGQRNDVADLLAAADIHCQPNIGPEPFGIVYVEALYAGRPAVSTRHGGAAEIIDESCGILVEPGRADQLADALAMLIDRPELRRELGSHGPGRAHKLCDPATQLAKFQTIVETRASARLFI